MHDGAVTGGSEVLGVLSGKEFPEAPTGGWCCMESATDDVKLRGFSFKAPSLSSSPWKKSNLVFSGGRIEATVQSVCSILKSSPVLHLASLACVPSYSPLCMGSPWPWAMWVLVATWLVSEGHRTRN